MSVPRYPPDHPQEWLTHAKSDLAFAKSDVPDGLLEMNCFHAQQAAEKALKAVLISLSATFDFTHDLSYLAELVRGQGITIPSELDQISELIQFAVNTRYPSGIGPVPHQLLQRAILLAEQTVRWAESVI